MSIVLLSIAGAIVIVALASYAGFLLVKVKKQKRLIQIQQQKAIEKRNVNIFENVYTLCMAGMQQQCDLSEIVIRVYCIMDYVQGEDRIDFSVNFPAIYELYNIVKDMARGEERQKLAKQVRMKQTLERQKAEARLSNEILKELADLKERITPLNNQIPIKMM
ncbi:MULTISPECIES: DUF2489 domain-containing protein [Vibrio]|uniref:DUF2489 domain-containing protein n=1 Tax=Vibrio casei TaxID=673372 RepID=A0A368LGL0_9VIBR|nr:MULTISPECIES: DUF2489 domain-containing protein [Vibrio]RCS69218.1 DUF2489 domain-containing protein [Vibrio casei]SJN37904.1 Periplasmic/membrane protein associated with DUF414 [Vibrio casei]HBV76255.1 DUF2489 domain-containing protein [Vibrio sp.]